MKIRFLKTVAVDIESQKEGFYSKSFSRWDEVKVQDVFPGGKFVTIKLESGDILHGVPSDSFEKLAEAKKTVSF